MEITGILASAIIIILPVGAILGDTGDKCGSETTGIYMDGKQYVCEGKYQAETLKHEEGHLIWDKGLSRSQRDEYTKLYNASMKHGVRAFNTEYAMTNSEEDFAENYMYIKMGWKTKPLSNKRIRLIISYLNSNVSI